MLIRVKVFAGSRKQEVARKSEDSFEVKVKEKPEMGRANRETTELLASYFKIPESKIKLIQGHRQRSKIFEIKK